MVHLAAVMALAVGMISPVTPTSTQSTQDEPKPSGGGVLVDVSSAVGTGCPAGTTRILSSPETGMTTVDFSAFLARVGVGAQRTDFRRTCQISLTIAHPAGFAVQLRGLDHTGYSDLAAGATGTQKVTYRLRIQDPGTTISQTLTGPYSDAWHLTHYFSPLDFPHGPCDEPMVLTITIDTRVAAGTSDTASTSSLMAPERLTIGPDSFGLVRCD